MSPEFWSGARGYRRIGKRLAIYLIVALAAALSLLAGPVSATLLLPKMRSDWPAGGADFSLRGDHLSLFPYKPSLAHTGGSACANPTFERLQQQRYNDSICVCAGYLSLAQTSKARYQSALVEASYVHDSGTWRVQYVDQSQMDTRSPSSVRVPHLATAKAVDALADFYSRALYYASSTKRGGVRRNWQ